MPTQIIQKLHNMLIKNFNIWISVRRDRIFDNSNNVSIHNCINKLNDKKLEGKRIYLLGLISPTFYAQFLRAQIPKAQKHIVKLSVFFVLLETVHINAACKTLMKLEFSGLFIF
jgi:hypothetical protein